MMRALFLLGLFWLGAIPAARADEQLVEQFDGHNSLTTADFNVPDHWELRWHSAQALSLGVIRLDNSVVAGTSGRTNGSLYLPHGGTYRIRVKGGDPIPWDIAVVSLGPVSATSGATDDAGSNAFYLPTPGPEDVTSTNAVPDGEVVAAAGTNSAPETVVPPPPPPVPTQLAAEQERAIVTVRGDRAEGAGFLLKTSTGLVVITSLSLISNNPRLDLITKAGAEIKTTTLQAATDRDLAMIGIEDDAYAKLVAATDISSAVQTGDTVLTSANGSANPSMEHAAQVTMMAPLRIEFAPFDAHGEIGGPVLQAKTGQVIAVVGAAPSVVITTDLDKVPFPTRETAIANSMSYFGLRLDTVTTWETCDWKRLAVETAFLDDFHQRSRCLDSYLNGKNNDNRPIGKLWQSDDKIKTANDNFLQASAGGDTSQRMESLRSLLFELGNVGDVAMDPIQEPANFYTYDQQRARNEIAYRQALKAELDYFSSNVNRFSGVERRNN
jgi:hypothetical protein